MSRTRPSFSIARCGADFGLDGGGAVAGMSLTAAASGMEQFCLLLLQAGEACMSMASTSYTLSDFDFALPPELIAQHPAPERSASRLLDGTVEPPVDRVFRELPSLLGPGDLLVFNDTKVIKARLFGRKATGGAVEALVERVLPGTTEVWAHLRASKSPKARALVRFADAFDAEVLGRCGPDG